MLLITWQDLFERADTLIQRQLLTEKAAGKPLLLQPHSRSGSLLLLAVGLLWPHPVYLDEKNVLELLDAVPLHEGRIPADLLPKGSGIAGGLPVDNSRFENWQLILCTSGSTGVPKEVIKSGRGLLAEVRDLARIYGWQPESRILSLVSPLHIYGLLHSFLLPLTTGSTVMFAQLADIEWQTQSWDAVIGVPAIWSYVKEMLVHEKLDTLIMSGAPFGEKRRQELQALPWRPRRAFELLGSTETGGIGYRSLLLEEDAFQPLPSVKIQGEVVESAYLFPEFKQTLADQLEVLPDGRFLHRGRMDRIFKYAGQRYALGEVEQALSLCLNQAEVFVRFHADEAVAQGGWLEAWVETAEVLDRTVLRGRYQSRTRAPFPQMIHSVRQFPRDTQGKLQVARLTAK